MCARGGNLFETSDLKGNATAGAEVLGGGGSGIAGLLLPPLAVLLRTF